MAKIGYARVSTRDQELQLQLSALRADGCERIYKDKLSGTLSARPGLDEALASLQSGDVLVVWRLDRLGRSLQHLIDTIKSLGDRGVGFRSLTEAIDTTNGAGKFMFRVFAALTEFERDIIIERIRAGLAVAAEKGHKGGRPPRLSPQQVADAREMVNAGKSIAHVARTLGVSRPVIYRAIERADGPEQKG